MLNAIKTIFQSKRSITALTTVIVDFGIVFGVDMEFKLVLTLVGAVTTLGALIISAFTKTDLANAETLRKAMIATDKPLDHKGQPLT